MIKPHKTMRECKLWGSKELVALVGFVRIFLDRYTDKFFDTIYMCVQIFLSLNLLPPFSLRLQGDKLSFCRMFNILGVVSRAQILLIRTLNC